MGGASKKKNVFREKRIFSSQRKRSGPRGRGRGEKNPALDGKGPSSRKDDKKRLPNEAAMARASRYKKNIVPRLHGRGELTGGKRKPQNLELSWGKPRLKGRDNKKRKERSSFLSRRERN